MNIYWVYLRNSIDIKIWGTAFSKRDLPHMVVLKLSKVQTTFKLPDTYSMVPSTKWDFYLWNKLWQLLKITPLREVVALLLMSFLSICWLPRAIFQEAQWTTLGGSRSHSTTFTDDWIHMTVLIGTPFKTNTTLPPLSPTQNAGFSHQLTLDTVTCLVFI